jgi:hypothetical protein
MENKLTFEKVLNGEINLVYMMNEEISRKQHNQYVKRLQDFYTDRNAEYHEEVVKKTLDRMSKFVPYNLTEKDSWLKNNLIKVMNALNDARNRKTMDRIIRDYVYDLNDKDSWVKGHLERFARAFSYLLTDENKTALDARLVECNKLIVELMETNNGGIWDRMEQHERFVVKTYEMFDPEYVAAVAKFKQELHEGITPSEELRDFIKHPKLPHYDNSMRKSSVERFAIDNDIGLDASLDILFGTKTLSTEQAIAREAARLRSKVEQLGKQAVQRYMRTHLYDMGDQSAEEEEKYIETEKALDRAIDELDAYEMLDHEEQIEQALAHAAYEEKYGMLGIGDIGDLFEQKKVFMNAEAYKELLLDLTKLPEYSLQNNYINDHYSKREKEQLFNLLKQKIAATGTLVIERDLSRIKGTKERKTHHTFTLSSHQPLDKKIYVLLREYTRVELDNGLHGFSKKDKELQAESISYMFCKTMGIKNDTTFSNITSWAEKRDADNLSDNMKSIVEGFHQVKEKLHLGNLKQTLVQNEIKKSVSKNTRIVHTVDFDNDLI